MIPHRLLRLARRLKKDKAKRVFLVNNYDLICSIFAERDVSAHESDVLFWLNKLHAEREAFVEDCVEINQCVGCIRQFFTKSFLGNDAAVLARSSGEERAPPRYRAGVASMAWRTTRRFSQHERAVKF